MVDAAEGANALGGNVERAADGTTSPEVLAFHYWYANWGATARAVVRREDWQVLNGGVRIGVVRRGGEPLDVRRFGLEAMDIR